jgi:hypothetical protein
VENGESFAVGPTITVRTDFTAGEGQRFAKREKDGEQVRRLLAIGSGGKDGI